MLPTILFLTIALLPLAHRLHTQLVLILLTCLLVSFLVMKHIDTVASFVRKKRKELVIGLLTAVVILTFFYLPARYLTVPLLCIAATHAIVKTFNEPLSTLKGRIFCAIVGGVLTAMMVFGLDQILFKLVCDIPEDAPTTGFLGITICMSYAIKPFAEKAMRLTPHLVGTSIGIGWGILFVVRNLVQ